MPLGADCALVVRQGALMVDCSEPLPEVACPGVPVLAKRSCELEFLTQSVDVQLISWVGCRTSLVDRAYRSDLQGTSKALPKERNTLVILDTMRTIRDIPFEPWKLLRPMWPSDIAPQLSDLFIALAGCDLSDYIEQCQQRLLLWDTAN